MEEIFETAKVNYTGCVNREFKSTDIGPILLIVRVL